jgi:AraC-like DNA-binding protein
MGFVRYFCDEEMSAYHLKHCEGQSHAFRKHAHEEHAIALVTGGSSLFKFVDEAFHVQKGQLVVIRKGLVHQCCPKCVEQWRFYMLHLSEEWISQAGFKNESIPAFAIRDLDSAEFERITLYFKTACNHIEEAEENLVLIAEAAFMQPSDQTLEWTSVDSDEMMLESVCDEIRARLFETISLDELAQKAQVDRYALIRRFGRRFNTTPHAWQNMLRMNAAKHLLENAVTIAETALEVGFYDQSHFTKHFKETFGITPKQFIQGRVLGPSTDYTMSKE